MKARTVSSWDPDWSLFNISPGYNRERLDCGLGPEVCADVVSPFGGDHGSMSMFGRTRKIHRRSFSRGVSTIDGSSAQPIRLDRSRAMNRPKVWLVLVMAENEEQNWFH